MFSICKLGIILKQLPLPFSQSLQTRGPSHSTITKAQGPFTDNILLTKFQIYVTEEVSLVPTAL